MQRTGWVVRGVRLALVGLTIAPGLWRCPPARAQAVSGTILGDVKDASGAVVPGATVSLVHAGTGFTRTLATDAKGAYTAPVAPDRDLQRLRRAPGLPETPRSPSVLPRRGPEGPRRAHARRSASWPRSSTCRPRRPLLQTSASDLSTTVDGRQIETLPLNGRNFVSLTRTFPGVLRGVPGANIDGAGGLAWRASASFSANGQRPRDNNFLLDGVDNNETWLQTVVIFPSVDALDEFKLQTSTYAAEFGRSLGGVVNLQIKSGTNQYRGGAFGSCATTRWTPTTSSTTGPGIAAAAASASTSSAARSAGRSDGPTFFFADYQGSRIDQGVEPGLHGAVADDARGGLLRGQPGDLRPLDRAALPGQRHPAERLDPAAASILDQLYPPPNTAGQRSATGQTINNYVVNPLPGAGGRPVRRARSTTP